VSDNHSDVAYGTATAGTGFSVEDARIAILNHSPQFELHKLTVEQEKVGKLDTSGTLVIRTLSWILVPLIASAILGESGAFFPAFPVDDGCGGVHFAFTEAVNAVRKLLLVFDQRLKMERCDITTSPKDNKSLYFSARLQDAVLRAIQEDLPKLFESLQMWIETRFERERQAVTGSGIGNAGSVDIDSEAASHHCENPDHTAKSRQDGNSEHGDKGASSDGKKDDMPLTGTRSSCNAGLQHLPGAGPAAGGGAAARFGGCFSSHPRVMALQDQMNQTEQWTPSIRVELKGRNLFGMVRPHSDRAHVVKPGSSCILNLCLDESDGIVKIIQICWAGSRRARQGVGLSGRSAREDRKRREQDPTGRHYMEYYFVYPNARAQLETSNQDDTTITLHDQGVQKTYTQVGAKTLLATAKRWNGVALYHAGDICHKSSERGAMNLGNIIGTIAWVPVATLLDGIVVHSKLTTVCEKTLAKDLFSLNIPKAEADAMAKEPIFLSCIFGEKGPASAEEDASADGDRSDAEEEEDDQQEVSCITGSGLVAEKPTLLEAQQFTLALRRKAPESGQAH
jgi:hypothetical protein